MGKSLAVDLCSGSGGTAESDRNFSQIFLSDPFCHHCQSYWKIPYKWKRARSLIPLGRITMTMATMELFAIVLGSNRLLVTGSPMYLCQLTWHAG
jgi:hypothetical protein